MSGVEIDYLADRPEFLPALAEWLHGEWGHLYPGATLETRTRDLENQMRRAEVPFTIVAHSGGEAVGTAALIENDLETHPDMTPWLASVFVPPERRRRGVAALLVGRIVETARGMGLPGLYLWTDKEAAYYAKMGWKRLFDEHYRGEDVTVMRFEVDAEHSAFGI